MTDKIKDNTPLVMVVTVAAFAVAVAVYFCPVALPHKIAIPVTILAFGARSTVSGGAHWRSCSPPSAI